ncbi:hypothetical protein EYC80_001860 [Monilinia laxa]|uniref:Uncharacterized protein n=1 Tax=Monilinia laxa TaxID=61186 RepID=A0A5N6K678_MONLA|nr:hypothetical protein EYC80_001860 [Monilinia laxa]
MVLISFPIKHVAFKVLLILSKQNLQILSAFLGYRVKSSQTDSSTGKLISPHSPIHTVLLFPNVTRGNTRIRS